MKPDNCQRFAWLLCSIAPHPISKFRGGVSPGGESASLTGAPGLPAATAAACPARGPLRDDPGFRAGLAVAPGPGLSLGSCFASPSQGLASGASPRGGGRALPAHSRRPGPAPLPPSLPPSARRPCLPPPGGRVPLPTEGGPLRRAVRSVNTWRETTCPGLTKAQGNGAAALPFYRDQERPGTSQQ